MSENNDSTNSGNKKRFVNIAKEPIFIVVNDTFEDEVLVDDDVVECLNNLHEENEELKRNIQDMRTGTYINANNIITELKNENEQLKSKLADANELKRIYVDFLVDKGFELSDVIEWSRRISE